MHRPRTVSLIAVVAAMTLALTAAAPLASARTADDLLTDQQRQEFVTGAQEVAGLTKTQIRLALTDPEALRGVPVRIGIETSPMGKDFDRPMATYGRTAWVTVSYYNVFGIRLASFKLTKYWQYNYSRVTYAPTPYVTASVTGTGAATGWEYKGVIGSSDYYYSWNGVWHGGHKSYRQGKFTTCIIKIGCWQAKHPWISIYAHYNGSWSYSYGK